MQEMQDTQVQSLGQEDPLEKEMTTHSSILAWSIPWTGETGGLQTMGSQRVRHDRVTNTFAFHVGLNKGDIDFHLGKGWLHPRTV